MQVSSDRRWSFLVEPEQFWSTVAEVDLYPTWWPWLRRFDAEALDLGERWRCTVAPPLPYRLRFDLTLEEVDRPRLVVASVTGDISGTARLDVEPDGDGCDVRLRSNLAPANQFLRAVARAARPVVRFGHDWVIDTGARQFRQRAL